MSLFRHPLSIFFCGAAIASGALAQPVPKLNSVSREWLQRGTKPEVSVYGENLVDATNVIISGAPGIRAKIIPASVNPVQVESTLGGVSSEARPNGNEVRIGLEIEGNAPLTERELRLVTAEGVSNPLALNVSPLPELNSANNQTRETAQKIALPAMISGVIQNAAESDFFQFTAKKGEHVILDVNVYRMGSRLDSSLAVLAKDGRELARNEDAAGLDSILDFSAPEDGDYFAELRDFRYQGGGDYKYRMRVGVLPHVATSYPYGGQRGKSVEIKLTGMNLESDSILLNLAADAPTGRQEIRTAGAKGLSNPFPLEVTDLPTVNETEPNSALDQADRISIPVAINGRINKEKDYDAFRFRAQKDERVVFEVSAFRFGSPLDAVLTLTDLHGNVLIRNDDSTGTDAKIDYTFKDSGDFHIIVEDLLNRGGNDYGYRLTAEKPQPDFSLTVTRDTPRIHRGGRVPLRCEVNRMNGFDDAVKIVCEGLPPGIFAEPLMLESSANSGTLVLQAAPDAPPGTFPLNISAASRGSGTSLRRSAQPFSNDKSVKAAFLTVLEAAPFEISPATIMALVEQNQNATIDVMIERREGFTGDVKITPEGFSSGRDPISRSFDVQTLTLKGAETRGIISLKARTDSEIATRPVILRGDVEQITEYSSLIPVRTTQIPFVLSTSLKKLVVTALPSGSSSAAAEAVFSVKCERRAGFNGEIEIKIEGVPEGVSATVTNLAANSNESTVRLVASEKAPTGKDSQLKLTGTGVHNDRTYRFSAGTVILSINAPESEEKKQPTLANTK